SNSLIPRLENRLREAAQTAILSEGYHPVTKTSYNFVPRSDRTLHFREQPLSTLRPPMSWQALSPRHTRFLNFRVRLQTVNHSAPSITISSSKPSVSLSSATMSARIWSNVRSSGGL